MYCLFCHVCVHYFRKGVCGKDVVDDLDYQKKGDTLIITSLDVRCLFGIFSRGQGHQQGTKCWFMQRELAHNLTFVDDINIIENNGKRIKKI